jgi:cysteine desulfurase / selenocysteine lyase
MSNPIDWNSIRKCFPVCKKFVYLISASTAPLNKATYDASKEFLDHLYYEGDESWAPTTKLVNAAREHLSKLVGGKPTDFGFGANTNHNMGLLAHAFKERSGLGNIVVSPDEFPSSYVPWKYLGYEIKMVEGDLSLGVDENTKAVISSSIHSFTGEKIDIVQLGKNLKEKDTPFILNATQSLGQFPLNLEEAHVTAMTCSVHKWLNAGYGASILYVSPGLEKELKWPLAGLMSFDDPEYTGSILKPIKDMRKIELGALPSTTLIGLESSLKFILDLGVKNISERVLELSQYLELKCEEKGLEILNLHPVEKKSGIVCLKIENLKDVIQNLSSKGILVNERRGQMRISLNYFNNKEDIDKLVSELKGQ